MTTPTLAQFQEALARVKAKHPGAPADLGDGYSFALNADGETCVVHDHFNHRTWLPAKSGEDRCTIKAMEVGAWWEQNSPGANMLSIGPSIQASKWIIELTQERYGIMRRLPCSGSHPSLPSAALAMLEVIGEA